MSSIGLFSISALLGQQNGTALWPRLLAASPLLWACLSGIAALMLLLPATTRGGRMAGAVLAVLSLSLILGGAMAPLAGRANTVVFWALAGVTLVAALAAISARSAVYTAIWFAFSLLGTAGLMFFQGAQFLGVATIAVYAGAIVVTFLFVIMLAQPEGHASYDRISWGWYTKSVSALMAALLVGVLTMAVQAAYAPGTEGGPENLAENVLHPSHMALFGRELFSRHLLSIEIAGSLLLVALVGALAIMIQSGELVLDTREGHVDE